MPKRGGTGLLIRGGLVIDPAQKLEAVRDILLEDGKVKGKAKVSLSSARDISSLVGGEIPIPF